MSAKDSEYVITTAFENGFYSGGDWRVWVRAAKDDKLLATATSRWLWRAVRKAVRDIERKRNHAARYH